MGNDNPIGEDVTNEIANLRKLVSELRVTVSRRSRLSLSEAALWLCLLEPGFAKKVDPGAFYGPSRQIYESIVSYHRSGDVCVVLSRWIRDRWSIESKWGSPTEALLAAVRGETRRLERLDRASGALLRELFPSPPIGGK